MLPRIPLRKRQRGLAMVETVLVAPVLLLLLLASAEITQAWIEHNTLTKSARIAARYVAGHALQGTTGVTNLSTGLVTETRNLLVFGNPAGTGAPVLPGLLAGNVQVQDLGDGNIQVTVVYAYDGILGNVLPSFGFGSDSNLAMNLEATVTMRAL
jgi:hypothetical protein